MICLHCGKEIVKNQYCVEKPIEYEARLATQFCRAKCARLHGPAKTERGKPTLQPVSANYQRPRIVTVKKDKTPRSEPYKAFIREQWCLLNGGRFGLCEGDVVPHHTDGGGMSLKGSDLSCVPLCCAHHLLMDNAGKKGRGIWTPAELRLIVNCLNDEFNRIQSYDRRE